MRVFTREPWRGSQFCGYQVAYGLPWSEFCAERKAPGEYACGLHTYELRMEGVGAFADGNAKGLVLKPSVYGFTVYDEYGDICASSNSREELEKTYGFTLMWEPYEGKEPVAPTEKELAQYADILSGKLPSHGYTWDDLRDCPAADLKEEDTFVRPGLGTVYRVHKDGTVSGSGIAWAMELDGTAWTVLQRVGDLVTAHSHDGRVESQEIPPNARVLKVQKTA